MKLYKSHFKSYIGVFLASIFLLSAVLPARADTPIYTPEPSSNTLNDTIFLPMIINPSSPAYPPSPTPTPIPTTPPPNMTYYISPSGNDNNTGTSEADAWATFNRAVNIDTPGNKLRPGDSLVLLDGVYNQTLMPNNVSGQPGNPITIRAQHDGKAIIDGQGVRIPVLLEDWRNASYYVIKGIIAKNSSGSVYRITADNNILRRVSGYNANTDENEHVFLIWANNTLIEDCIAAGSGRKMIVVFSSDNSKGQHNTIRRCFASYREWDGRNWHDEWPWNENFESYNGDYNTFENDIAYGYFAHTGFSLMSNGPSADAIGNKILGSIAILGGRSFEGDIINWGFIRPQPTDNSLIKNIQDPSNRSGFILYHDGVIRDNLLQDIFSWGNASVGISVWGNQTMTNNLVNRATISNNGLGLPYGTIDAFQEDLSRLTITNSRIDVIKSSDFSHQLYQPVTGEGARLQYRYVNGVLKDGSDGTPAQPLWPWPMEQRIRDELGISVTNLIAGIIPSQVNTIQDTKSPFLSVSPPFQPFGDVKLGQPSSKLINLKNTGTATLTVDGYQWGVSNSQFSITSGGTCSQPPFSLAPSQSCSVEVTFSPNDYHAQSNDLYFISSDISPYPSKPSIYVSGIGYSTTSPIPLPTKLEAEAFTNSSGSFEIKPTVDDGGSGKIASIQAGSWLEYPVNITQTGQYNITARVASIPTTSGIQFSVVVDGNTVATFYPPNTGGWDTFTDINIPNVYITQGSHTIRINLTTGSYDLNYLKLTLP